MPLGSEKYNTECFGKTKHGEPANDGEAKNGGDYDNGMRQLIGRDSVKKTGVNEKVRDKSI